MVAIKTYQLLDMHYSQNWLDKNQKEKISTKKLKHLFWKYSTIAGTNYLAGKMKSSVIANQKARIKLHRKIFERIKKSNEKHFVNLCETIPPSAL